MHLDIPIRIDTTYTGRDLDSLVQWQDHHIFCPCLDIPARMASRLRRLRISLEASLFKYDRSSVEALQAVDILSWERLTDIVDRQPELEAVEIELSLRYLCDTDTQEAAEQIIRRKSAEHVRGLLRFLW